MARKIDEQKNLKTRNEIITTSIEMILEKGFSKFTLSELAKQLKKWRALILFAKKETLHVYWGLESALGYPPYW